MDKLTNKKIAIVHDSFTQFGGAERVLFYLIKMFPQADIYTSLIKKGFDKRISEISTGKLYYSKLSKFSLAIKHPSFFKPYFFHHYWEKLNLDNYDLVISSSHSFCAHFVKVKNKHLCYMYTTPRFLHDEFNEISWLQKPIIDRIFRPYFNFLIKKNKKKIHQIDILITDSINVQKRIKKYYEAKSIVIYPPVKLAKNSILNINSQTKNYLFFSRLVKQKGIELVIKAFNKNQKSLLVIGTSDQEKKWQKLANKNIKFLGFVPDKKLSKIFKSCKALIYASIEEDFGMIPVEAMSYGLPVIAYKDGGVKETIINKETGLFFNKYEENFLNQTIEKFEKLNFDRRKCIKRAQKFSEKKFKNKFLKKIGKLMSE
jgi:glycosyltransferase involved in cell wall biosynthesis